MKQLEPTKKIITADKTEMYYWNGKLHNWEGCALIPEGNKKKGEYYLFGIKKTKLQWLAAKKDINGVPPAKNPLFKSSM